MHNGLDHSGDLPAEMQAAQVQRYGGPDVIDLVQATPPRPDPAKR